MTKFIDDFAGALYDIFNFALRSICYFIAGMIIVGVPLYLIAMIFDIFN